MVKGSVTADAGYDFTLAAAAFVAEYNGAVAGKNVKGGDLVDVQYEDGSIVEFSVQGAWKITGLPIDPKKPIKIKQGPYGAKPTSLYQPNGNPISFTLYPTTSATTPTYTLIITQFGGGCDGCTSSTTAPVDTSGGGGSGGGVGGTSDPAPPRCTSDDCGGDGA